MEQPVTQQPVGSATNRANRKFNMPFMAHPPMPLEGCPPGLEYLAELDHLFVRQCLEPIETLTGIETPNAYQVFANGCLIYWAQEYSDFYTRQCCAPSRPFMMKVYDGTGAQVMRLIRPRKCCMQEIIVEAPEGTVLGTVQERHSCCGAEFVCKNASGEPIIHIGGTSVLCQVGQVEFQVVDNAGEVRGKVTRHWGGKLQEVPAGDDDQFGISFPATLSVEAKAVIFGACVLIDCMFFEM